MGEQREPSMASPFICRFDERRLWSAALGMDVRAPEAAAGLPRGAELWFGEATSRVAGEREQALGKEPRGIQSIEVGGRLLKALVASAVPMMLKDLAAAADMTPAQAHAYLASYRRVGLVEQDAATGRYRMGAFAVRLAIARLRTVPELSNAIRATTELAKEFGIMATLSVWGPHGPTVVHKQDGDEALNVNIRAGTMFSIVRTATGYVFAAFSPGERVTGPIEEAFSALEPVLGAPARDRGGFEALVETTRRQGFAVTSESPVPGVNAIAAPVLDEHGEAEAVITLIGSAGRLPLTLTSNRILSRLAEAAGALSGHRSSGGEPAVGRTRIASLREIGGGKVQRRRSAC